MKSVSQPNDGISMAFEMIIDEIEGEADKIAGKGTEAFRNKDYAEARKLSDAGQGLWSFARKLMSY